MRCVANCGSTQNLARCSRCRTAYFCSAKCQKAYWPFHREWCRRNDFADALEKTEPKFAKFLRKHGKQAVLKDDEVERIERQGFQVVETMYGLANPKPALPTYTVEERALMALKEEQRMLEQRSLDRVQRHWQSIEVRQREGLGMDHASFDWKWTQNQSWVEAFFLVPKGISSSDITVVIQARHLLVEIGERRVVDADLCAMIKPEDSTWLLDDRVISISMLKVNRRDNYADGCTNADTWWKSLTTSDPTTLQLQYPPNEYYSTTYDKAEAEPHRLRNRRYNPSMGLERRKE